MAEYDKHTLVAPRYRYYTVDLLSNKVLAEIPFGGVSYERALKSAGAFSGKIPVLNTPASRSWDLYNSTMPGKTGLYVMRDNDCVWGGVIWGRSYDLVTQELSVDASEFTSYFHHRRIWKSWSHIYGATVNATNGTATVQFDSGISTDLSAGASVRFDFDNPNTPVDWLAYNGYYTIAADPRPTRNSFSISGSVSTAEMRSVERVNNTLTVYTKGAHGFTTGNIITINVAVGPKQFNGTYAITASSGANSSYFTVNLPGDDLAMRTTTGVSTRPLPDGVYTGVTVSVRTDTYAFVRALVNSVFEDFTGIGFADAYLTPGQQFKLDVLNKQSQNGYATLTTKTDHNLIPGQSIDILNVGAEFNGTVTVLDTLHTNQFRYRNGGNVGSTNLGIKSATVIARSATKGVATMYTKDAHGFEVGNTAVVNAGGDPDERTVPLSGEFVITRVPSANSFQYNYLGEVNIDYVDLTQPLAVSGGNEKKLIGRAISNNQIILVGDSPLNGFVAGNNVSIFGIDLTATITNKGYESSTNRATITTQDPHYYSVGDVAVINGLQDVSKVVKKKVASGEVTLTTENPHGIKVGDQVSVNDIRDGYTIDSRSISGGTAYVTFKNANNMQTGERVKIADVYEQHGIVAGKVANNVATITLPDDHLVSVNTKVHISGLDTSVRVTDKHLYKNVVHLKTRVPHNFKVGQSITIDNCGKPFDGTYKITDVDNDSIKYKVKSDAKIPSTEVKNGTATGRCRPLNISVVVSAVEGNKIKFPVEANNIHSVIYIPFTTKIRYLSPINGENLLVKSNSGGFTVGIETTAGDRSSTFIYGSDNKDDPKPRVSASSIANGSNFTVKRVTRDSFTYTPSRTTYYYYGPSDVKNGSVISPSIFNGARTITDVTDGTFAFAFNNPRKYNIQEMPVTTAAYAKAPYIFNNTYTMTSIDYARNIIYINLTHGDIPAKAIGGFGNGTVSPLAISSTYGPFPGNSNIGINFSTQDYSGDNIPPASFRGSELTNVGEALDSYSDSVNGFEYRIDCEYDESRSAFVRTFVLLPISYPNPPEKGQASPPSRFKADKVVFEYPGNINTLTIAESAENSATRFFATGDSSGGEGAATTVGVAAATDLLSGPDGTRWPLLDDDEKISKVTDKDVLYTYANRYLIEGRPPGVNFTVSVNGSLSPYVGYYNPGDWCSLIVNDEFVLQRLRSDLEPRDDIIVRKIQSFKVSVPDGSTVPEKVELTLVRETQVDSIGK